MKAEIFDQTLNNPAIQDNEPFTVKPECYTSKVGTKHIALSFFGGEFGELGFRVDMDMYDCLELMNQLSKGMLRFGTENNIVVT